MRDARLDESASGLSPVTDGWFVVDVRDAEWWAGAVRDPDGRLALGPGGAVSRFGVAEGYGASVAEETSDWRQAYATIENFRRERPPRWARLPWTSG